MATKLDLDLRNVQEQVEDNIKRLQQLNRRGVLAYIGLWSMLYDQAKALVEGSAAWLEQVEQRGMKVEEAINDQLLTLDNQAAREVKKWREWLQTEPQTLKHERADAMTNAETEIEQRIEQILTRLGIPHRDRLERLSREIDELSRKLDAQLQQQTQATQSAEPDVEAPEAPLPLADYDKLNAKTVISQLRALNVAQLQAVRAYESNHAARTTVLREIDQQLKRDLAIL